MVNAMKSPPFILSLACAWGWTLFFAGWVGIPVVAAEGEGKLSQADLEFFENQVRPALINNCYECHSEEGKRKGGLWLDRKAGWVEGGDSGPAAIPGDVDGSLLIETVRYHDPDLEMPPDGKMADETIAIFEEWVRRGLPDPRVGEAATRPSETIDVETGRDYWSFRPLQYREPRVEGHETAIDYFVDARLAERGFDAAPRVDPESLLRRVKTDLVGFAPTIDEQDEFLADPTRGNLARMMDRWLAQPEFGERWARHWLDLARYADTSGGGRALTFSEAWRFRDFVIDAFREDLPLDQLITAHLAGDLLPYETEEERIRNLVATGFLVLGPHNYENQNKDLLELEIVDEQIDTMGKAFLGMTLGCARCHDHKFDPIPTKDYYSLAGIFLSTEFVQHANVSKWHTEPIPPSPETQKAIMRFDKEKEKLEGEEKEWKALLAKHGVGAGGKDRMVPSKSLPGIVIDNKAASLRGEWMESTSQPRWVDAGYIHDQNTLRGEKSVMFQSPAIEEAGEYELRISYSPGTNRNPAVPVQVETAAGVEEFVVNQKLDPAHDELFHRLGTFSLEEGELPVVTISNDTDTAGVVIADAVQWLPLAVGKKKPGAEDELTEQEREEIEKAQSELARIAKRLGEIKKERPVVPEAMCVVDREEDRIGDTPVRIRGVEDNHGEMAPRGFLQVASFGEADEFAIPEKASGRLELARWITDERNPLTARVLANRIWKHLVGKGIVRTVDNFGMSGEEPSHPELLDYLAKRLIDSGWSAKSLIREIMLSEVYARDSEFRSESAEVKDPENHLLWKAHKRAIDVEVMRDTMLDLAGVLDRESEGSSLPEGFRSEFGFRFETTRRSVYVPVFRNAGYEMFTLFDFANPNFSVGNRGQSEIATQALYLMNSPTVHRHAGEASSTLLQETAASDEERIEIAFRRTLGRRPTVDEQKMALAFLRASGDPENGDDADAWAALQRGLFASVDFRFLR